MTRARLISLTYPTNMIMSLQTPAALRMTRPIRSRIVMTNALLTTRKSLLVISLLMVPSKLSIFRHCTQPRISKTLSRLQRWPKLRNWLRTKRTLRRLLVQIISRLLTYLQRTFLQFSLATSLIASRWIYD